MGKIERQYQSFVQGRQDKDLARFLQQITRPDARTLGHGGKDYINFSSNDYLGLSRHPLLVKRAQDWAGEYGAGSGASRLVTGNLAPFTQIEDKVAALKNKEAALIMVSGFQANAGILPALLDKTVLGAEPLVFSDKLNHASIHLGCAAAGVKQIRYRHNDMDHLESLLQKHAGSERPKFIITESVFSMDGDIAPLDEIAALAARHDAFLICDEAHATGVLGDRGQGLGGRADLAMGTFSKAPGGFGAYIACTGTVKEYLVNKCAGLIYATALPPAVLGTMDAALDLIPDMTEERARVLGHARRFRAAMDKAGLDTGASATQIVPVIIGDAPQTLDFSNRLKDLGFWATAIRPPTVPPGTARIRFAFSAAHTEDDVAQLIDTLTTKMQKAA